MSVKQFQKSYLAFRLEKPELVEYAPIVRCKDCQYFKNAKVNAKGFLICLASGMEITENDYCSYAEKENTTWK